MCEPKKKYTNVSRVYTRISIERKKRWNFRHISFAGLTQRDPDNSVVSTCHFYFVFFLFLLLVYFVFCLFFAILLWVSDRIAHHSVVSCQIRYFLLLLLFPLLFYQPINQTEKIHLHADEVINVTEKTAHLFGYCGAQFGCSIRIRFICNLFSILVECFYNFFLSCCCCSSRCAYLCLRL